MAAQEIGERSVSVYRTAVFILHNPSRYKRPALQDALYRYHLAYGKILDLLSPKIDDFRAVKKACTSNYSLVFFNFCPLLFLRILF
jgi:hypothetical protein